MFKISEKLKRIVALVIVIFFAVLMMSTLIVNLANADERSDLEDKQQSLKDDKQEIRNEIDGLDEKKKDVMAEKEEIDREVTSLEGEIDEVNVEIGGYESKLADIEAELAIAEENLDNQYETYKTRVRVMYENGAMGYLEILLSAESISDFFEKIEIVTQIAEYDSNLVKRLKAEKEKIQEKKDEIEVVKDNLVESKNVLVNKKGDLDVKMAKRDAMIQEIEDSKSSLEAQLKKIEAEEAEVRRQIASLSRNNSKKEYTGGSMLWPTPSCHIITSYYGWRLHPVLLYEKLHTGIDIGAGYGAKIIAAQSGTVIKATYNGAYGNYVVVDHGGGVCTLYAHQSSMAVSVGQEVSAGDVIGFVGSTGYSTGPHLHFEVIINGATTDPLGYIS